MHRYVSAKSKTLGRQEQNLPTNIYTHGTRSSLPRFSTVMKTRLGSEALALPW